MYIPGNYKTQSNAVLFTIQHSLLYRTAYIKNSGYQKNFLKSRKIAIFY